MPRSFLLVALLAAAASAGDTYPAFRGDGSGRSDAKNLPREWSPKSLAWKLKLPGYGQSSPVVFGGKVFVTAVEGPKKETNLVVAYDLATGKELWRRTLPATQQVASSFSVARAAPTPTVDADGLYVFFESGELAKYTHEGKQGWLRSLVKEYGEIKNGHQLGSSLAQTADAVFALVDHQGPSYLLAVSKKTGKNLWKADRKSRMAWTSPVVVRHGNKDRVVVSSGGSVDVYDAASGDMLSTYANVKNNNVPSAVVQGGLVVVGASDPPRGGDRDVTLKSCCCLELDKDGKLSEKPLWHSEKATASFASPLIHRDCVYYLNTVGVLSCLDLKTGKEHYSERTPGGCWASPMAAGDRVYLFGRNGVTTVVKAGPKFEKLATNRFWDEGGAVAKDAYKPKEGGMAAFGDPILYGVAVVDGRIVARSGTELFAVAIDDKPSPALRAFGKDDVGKLPAGWKADQTNEGKGSVWKVVADDTAPSGFALAQTASGPSPMFNLCLIEKSSAKDVEVTVKFKAVAGKIDQGGGVVWRYQDPKNYYICRYNPLEGNFRVYKIHNGKRVQLGTKEGLTLGKDKWYTLSISQVGDAITCSLEGENHLEVKDDTFAKAGQVGLWTKADAQTHFAGLVVKEK